MPTSQPLALYNEIDEHAAEWLRGLIDARLIAPGIVNTQSICDLQPADLAGFTQVHFFAGIGGWSLAARLAGWPDDRPLWTGSCPCQPFSLAGKQKGFADDRHLWPYLRNLIQKRRPPVVFGEQVASASAWLGLVRSDLEALEYAVGAMPIEAASAGADHLRDRYWFVADDGSGRFAGQNGWQVQQPGRAETFGSSSAERHLGHSHSQRLALRSISEVERGNLRREGTTVTASSNRGGPLADADGICGQIDPDARGSAEGSSARPLTGPVGACDGDLANGSLQRRGDARDLDGSAERSSGQDRTGGNSEFRWVLGADGKARRVKSGIRLLAHGVRGRVAVRRAGNPASERWINRVGALKGFGNAIDPRPASEFIGAYMDCAA